MKIETYTSKLSLNSKLKALPRLTEWVAELSIQLGLSKVDKYRLDLSLSEAVTNIIQYGYSDQADHHIEIQSRKDPHSLEIKIIDDGRAFDPRQAPEVTPPASLEEAKIGGLGIHFIRNLTDAWDYQRDEDQNRLTLVFHLNK